jgi:hypothetical protein
VIQGGDAWSGCSSVVFVLSVPLAIAAAGIASVSPLPWLREGGAALVCFGTFVLAVAVSFGLWRRSVARSSRVVLDELGVEISRDLFHENFPWRDLAGYRDGDTDFVELVRPAGVARRTRFPRLTVPTLTEKDRVAVLAFLDARGIRRLD